MRKLSFPNGKDKIIQECVRLILYYLTFKICFKIQALSVALFPHLLALFHISLAFIYYNFFYSIFKHKLVLDCIYEPSFSNLSHGYRPNRSIHSAVAQIQTWKSSTWLIEGDISACFDEVDHRVLESILRERISDERFINLINKLLRAGYLDTALNFTGTNLGTGQGSICSPILANVYLDKFDKFMEELILRETKGQYRKQNPEYLKLRRQLKKAEANEDTQAFKLITQKLKTISSIDVMDTNFIRVKYVRYADDCAPRKCA